MTDRPRPILIAAHTRGRRRPTRWRINAGPRSWASRSSGARTSGCSPAAAFYVADLTLPHMLHAVFVRSRRRACAHPRDRSGRCQGRARRGLCALRHRARARAAAGGPTRSSPCRRNGPRRCSTSSSTRSSRCSRTTRCGTSARPSRWSWPRRARRPRTPPAGGRSISSRCRRWSTPRARCARRPMVHERFQTNLIGEFSVGKGDVAAALARAPHRL